MPIYNIAENTNTTKTLVGLRRHLLDDFSRHDRGSKGNRRRSSGQSAVAAWLAADRGANEASGAPTITAPRADHCRVLVRQLAGHADAG